MLSLKLWQNVFVLVWSKAVFGAMTGADPDAIWVMQGWIFLNVNNNFKSEEKIILLYIFCIVAMEIIARQLLEEFVSEVHNLSDIYQHLGSKFSWELIST